MTTALLAPTLSLLQSKNILAAQHMGTKASQVSVQQEEENVEQAEEKKSLKGRFGLYMIESYVEIRRDLLEEGV